jgi:hypothetical protein
VEKKAETRSSSNEMSAHNLTEGKANRPAQSLRITEDYYTSTPHLIPHPRIDYGVCSVAMWRQYSPVEPFI